MGEKVLPGCNTSCQTNCGSGNACIETGKIYDSCRDKECIENLRVYLTEAGQCLVDRAISVKAKKAEIIWIYSDVEPVQFNRGYYTVDLRIFFKVTLDIFTGVGRPCTVEGLAVYDKKVILFGSEGNAKTFRSKYKFDDDDVQLWHKNNLPEAHIDVCANIIHKNKSSDWCKLQNTTKKMAYRAIMLLTIPLEKCTIIMYT